MNNDEIENNVTAHQSGAANCYKVFKCPLHGLEIEVFCFRACDFNNKHLWAEYQLNYKRNLSDKEANDIIEQIKTL